MQASNKSLKQKLTAIIIALALAMATFNFTLPFGFHSANAETSAERYYFESVNVSNKEFSDSSSGTPASPSSWTENDLNGRSKNNVVSGVVDLNSLIGDKDLLEDYGLDDYDEFKGGGNKVIRTPFGKADGKYDGSDANALLINATTDSAFGYSSSSVTLATNSYYAISVFVKTGSLTEGANVRLSGLKNNLVFNKIITTDDVPTADNDYGWSKYTFYIQTASMYESTVSLNLQVGESYEYTDKYGVSHPVEYTSKGYALFDHVEVLRYSRNNFFDAMFDIDTTVAGKPFDNPDKEGRTYTLNASGTSMYYSENDAEYLTVGGEDIGSFSNGLLGNGWSYASNGQRNGLVGAFSALDENLGITDDIPYSPSGAENDNILVLSSFDRNDGLEGKFDSINMGVSSEEFTIERFTNYRLSFWVKTINGSVAGAAIDGFDYRGPYIDDAVDHMKGEGQLRKEMTELAGDSNTDVHNGWKEYAFYLKGSAFEDYNVKLEFWLGGQKTYKAGVAMFDDVRIEKISLKQYEDYSGKGTAVTFDPVISNASIANGYFSDIDSFDPADYDAYPNMLFTPSKWTRVVAGADETQGASTRVRDENYLDYFVSGVFPYGRANTVDYVTPDGRWTKDIGINVPTLNEKSNLLLMKSDLPVAAGYRSPSFSVSSSTVQRVDVTLDAYGIAGYGANVVLKDGKKVIASIEGIKNTNEFKTYSLYVKTGDTSLNEVYVEIWLGLFDKVSNENKLSTGTVLVKEISLTNLSGGDNNTADVTFMAGVASYQTRIDEGAEILSAYYDATETNFTSFERYTDDVVHAPYNWSATEISNNEAVIYGIYDARDTRTVAYLPDGYKQPSGTRFGFLIKNSSPAYSRIKLDKTFSLASGSYFAIKVVARVDIPAEQVAEDYMGAYIGIVDSEYVIKDIRSTNTAVNIFDDSTDEGEFTEYVFYIHTAGDVKTEDSGADSNVANTVISLEFGIGGAKTNNYAVGSLMIASISVETSSAIDFEDAKAKLENGIGASKYVAVAEYAEDDEDEEEETTESKNLSGDNWYLYTTVILAVVLLFCVVAVAVRYYGLKRKREASKNPVKSTSSYDREKTLKVQHNKRNKVVEVVSDAYETFDEEYEEALEEKRLNEELAEYAKAEAEEAEDEQADEPQEAETSDTVEDGEGNVDDNADDESATAEEVGETEVAEIETAESTEKPAEDATAETPAEDEAYKYSDEIVDFTPSEEKRKELEEKKAQALKLVEEREAEKKRKEEEREKAEALRREVSRKGNDWDTFED